jgi:hypothetical protein
MKRIVATYLLVLLTVTAVAQGKAPKFLGIPIDGKKADVVSALKEKGFTYDAREDILKGKFNGIASVIFISENYGKVDRIIVTDETTTRDDVNIRSRYNNLLSQFQNLNGKYYVISPSEPIPDDEDVSYEMSIHKKRYEAVFYYNPLVDDEELARKIVEETQAEVQEAVDSGEMTDPTEERLEQLRLVILAQKTIKITSGRVWFTIIEDYGKYRIAIYYENMDNMPNGEDL